jgi:uncharacterized cupredoxin-like copper-binding protein
MRPHYSTLIAIAGALAVFVTAGDAIAATVIKVQLEDGTDGIKGMRLKTSRPSAPAGEITFQIVNESKSREHEFNVIKTDAASPAALPSQGEEVDLNGLPNLGESGDLEPGASHVLTVNLKPGNYILICNEPGHAHQGMWSRFRVTGH